MATSNYQMVKTCNDVYQIKAKLSLCCLFKSEEMWPGSVEKRFGFGFFFKPQGNKWVS